MIEFPHNIYISEFSAIERDYKDPFQLGWGSMYFQAYEHYKSRTVTVLVAMQLEYISGIKRDKNFSFI